jgi:hypothetical protein
MLNNQLRETGVRAGSVHPLAESSYRGHAPTPASTRWTASRSFPAILPSVMIGVPIGAWLIRHLRSETFRRICMSFDAGRGVGISTLLRELRWVDSPAACGALGILIDGVLLYRFFSRQTALDRDRPPSRSSLNLQERPDTTEFAQKTPRWRSDPDRRCSSGAGSVWNRPPGSPSTPSQALAPRSS